MLYRSKNFNWREATRMIHIFIGTKAQLIKMAPIMRELQLCNIEYNFIFSGQHQETIDEIRANFGVKEPDYILHKGKDITSIVKMGYWLVKIVLIALFDRKKIWCGDTSGVVLNHGDTFSTLAGSILARLGGHTNAHVESGLRSFDWFNPFPEEITRILVFKFSQIYFCPNEWAAKNLVKYNGKKIITNGNTLYDSLTLIKSLLPPADLSIPNKKFCVVSFHRFENVFKKSQLIKIVELLEAVSMHIDLLVIMHKPTLKKLHESGAFNRLQSNQKIHLRPRYDYHRFIHLVKASEFVITDGGSNQEECFYLGKPCLLLRTATERQEGLGENIVISSFNLLAILAFVKNYALYKKNEIILQPSPSSVIVNSLKDFSVQHT